MFPAVDDPPYWSGMLVQDGLLAALEVDPLDLPVHTGAEGLVVVGAEADVHHGGAVLEGSQQRAVRALALALRLVQVHILVPGGGEQPRGRFGRKHECGDSIVRGLRELELRS